MLPIEISSLMVQEARKVKVEVPTLPGLQRATFLLLHPHMVDKDLYFSIHSLNPNPMASLMLNDFLKSMAPVSHTEVMAA